MEPLLLSASKRFAVAQVLCQPKIGRISSTKVFKRPPDDIGKMDSNARQKFVSLDLKLQVLIVVLILLFMLLVVMDLTRKNGVCRGYVYPCLRFIFKTLIYILSWILFLLFQICSWALFLVRPAVSLIIGAIAAAFRGILEAFKAMARMGRAIFEGVFKTLAAAGGAAVGGVVSAAVSGGAALAGLGSLLAVSGLGLVGGLLGLLAGAVAALTNQKVREQLPNQARIAVEPLNEFLQSIRGQPAIVLGVLIGVVLTVFLGTTRVYRVLLLGGLIICVTALVNKPFGDWLLGLTCHGQIQEPAERERHAKKFFAGLMILICIFVVLLLVR